MGSRILRLPSCSDGASLTPAMKKFLVNLAVGIVAAIGLSSCIQSHTVVSVNKDGTATIEEKTVMSGMIAQMLQGFAGAFEGKDGEKPPGAGTNPLLDKASYEKRAKEMGEGVVLKEVKELKDAKGGIGVHAVFTVADINKLKLTSTGGDVPEALKGLSPDVEELKGEEVTPITFGFKDGELSINVPQPEHADEIAKSNEELEGLEPELNLGPEQAQQLEMTKLMMQDMAISLKVRIVDGIAKTDAAHRVDSDITLFEIKFSEVLKDPNAFSKLVLLGEDVKDKNKAMAVLKKLPGITLEPKEKVSVTLK